MARYLGDVRHISRIQAIAMAFNARGKVRMPTSWISVSRLRTVRFCLAASFCSEYGDGLSGCLIKRQFLACRNLSDGKG